jgi:hypothetical protein
MPSMHVSLAFLFCLAMRKVSKAAGLFFGLFFVVVLIGSVHLAYHYAVDGYASIIVTSLIWTASGAAARTLTRSQGSPAPTNLTPAVGPMPALRRNGAISSDEA